MRPLYKRENLILTEFDVEDVITTSILIEGGSGSGSGSGNSGSGGSGSGDSVDPNKKKEIDNVFRSFSSFNPPGSWWN